MHGEKDLLKNREYPYISTRFYISIAWQIELAYIYVCLSEFFADIACCYGYDYFIESRLSKHAPVRADPMQNLKKVAEY
jgi:hypothetical protein